MLVSLSDMKNFLGVTVNTYDAFLTLQIQIISDAIEGYTRRKFAQANYTQKFYRKNFSYCPGALPLFHYPLISVASILEKDQDADAGVAVTDYLSHIPSATLEMNSGRFFQNGKIVVVSYTAGYATVPALIQNVVYSLVQERYNKKVNGIDLNFGSDVQRISIPGAISLDFDYSLNNNERKNAFGQILGAHLNVLDSFRSERALVGEVRASYVQ